MAGVKQDNFKAVDHMITLWALADSGYDLLEAYAWRSKGEFGEGGGGGIPQSKALVPAFYDMRATEVEHVDRAIRQVLSEQQIALIRLMYATSDTMRAIAEATGYSERRLRRYKRKVRDTVIACYTTKGC